MDMNRNAIWHHPEKVPRDGIERMARFWGDESWSKAAYAESKQANMFGFEPEKIKQPNDTIVAAFVKRLKEVAGFSFVPDPLPMRNSTNAVVYYLFLRRRNPWRSASSLTYSASTGGGGRDVGGAAVAKLNQGDAAFP
ncbi:MAG: hypothetical protein IPK78_11245 [Rhodospirillales bacterium]|nr:hypothetical protein [Rhodospirillales bacterium]